MEANVFSQTWSQVPTNISIAASQDHSFRPPEQPQQPQQWGINNQPAFSQYLRGQVSLPDLTVAASESSTRGDQSQVPSQPEIKPEVVRVRLDYAIVTEKNPKNANVQSKEVSLPGMPAKFTIDPPRLLRPRDPAMTQRMLQQLAPLVLYVPFACVAGCRTYGICVHYQFVIPFSRCPDELVCTRCTEGPVEAVRACASNDEYTSKRRCPLHNTNKTGGENRNMNADFFPTKEQMTRCREILRRSVANDWDGIMPAKLQGHQSRCKNERKRRADTSTNDERRLRMEPRVAQRTARQGVMSARVSHASFHLPRSYSSSSESVNFGDTKQMVLEQAHNSFSFNADGALFNHNGSSSRSENLWSLPASASSSSSTSLSTTNAYAAHDIHRGWQHRGLNQVTQPAEFGFFAPSSIINHGSTETRRGEATRAATIGHDLDQAHHLETHEAEESIATPETVVGAAARWQFPGNQPTHDTFDFSAFLVDP